MTQSTIADEMVKEYGTEEKADEGPEALIQRAGQMILSPMAVPTDGVAMESSALFPDDQWDDVEGMPDHLYVSMAEAEVPVDVLSVAPRGSKYGPMFRVIVELTESDAGEGPRLYSIAYGYDPTYGPRNEKLAKLAYVLFQGAERVGPFVLTLGPENPNGNRFKSLKAIRRKDAKPISGRTSSRK